MKVIVFVLLVTIVRSQSIINFNSSFNNRRCENPNRRPGTCVAIRDCQVLSNSDRSFIEASQCGGGFGREPFVCCSSDTGFTQIQQSFPNGEITEYNDETTTELARRRSNWFQRLFRGNFFGDDSRTELIMTAMPNGRTSDILPQPPTCGGEFIDNRIYGGTDTSLYEFPWMAFLEYSKVDPTDESVCAGTLISRRYIVTAAHCVNGPIVRRKGELIAARLGLLDYSEDSEEVQRYPIEQTIVHENYVAQKTPSNDIALLRLAFNVRYSKTIRPICLPSALEAYNLKPNTKLTVVGWGATGKQPSTTIKQKVNVPLWDMKVCRQQYNKLGLELESSHLCAGGVANKDSCRGDSGAPLMNYRKGVWVLEGIVSFGRRCGIEDWPGVYARVSSYLDWIQRNIRI